MYTCIRLDMAEKDTPIDEMTDEQLDRLSREAALDWQVYCNLVLPDCSHYFFVNGCEDPALNTCTCECDCNV